MIMKNPAINSGFTLIELMIVIVIIGIIIAITVPNFTGAALRAKDAHLKSNMHIVQEIQEIYSIDNGGVCTTINNLVLQKDWKTLTNPFTLKEGNGESYYSLNLSTVSNLKNGDGKGGLLGLESIEGKKYYIYASDQSGNEYLKHKGTIFYLTNS